MSFVFRFYNFKNFALDKLIVCNRCNACLKDLKIVCLYCLVDDICVKVVQILGLNTTTNTYMQPCFQLEIWFKILKMVFRCVLRITPKVTRNFDNKIILTKLVLVRFYYLIYINTKQQLFVHTNGINLIIYKDKWFFI